MAKVGEQTKKALLQLYKEKKSLADKCKVVMGDSNPDVSKLEKEVSEMEDFFIEVLGIDPKSIEA